MPNKTEFIEMLEIARYDAALNRKAKEILARSRAVEDNRRYQKALIDAKKLINEIMLGLGVVLHESDFTSLENGDLVIAWDSDTSLVLEWKGLSFPISGDEMYLYNATASKSRWISFGDLATLADLVGEEI